jgi:biopolymer transport protein TolR
MAGELRGGDKDKSPFSQINVTPLVDVMLVLLIIFMVTASVGQQGITVSLPKAKARTQKIESDEKVITVTIDRSMQVYLNDAPVPLAELGPRLRETFASRKDKTVFLKSDQSVSYGDFVKVVAVVKDAGVEQLGMITEPPKQ